MQSSLSSVNGLSALRYFHYHASQHFLGLAGLRWCAPEHYREYQTGSSRFFARDDWQQDLLGDSW